LAALEISKEILLSKINIKHDVFVWASDFEDYRGEGRLARVFIKNISKRFRKSFLIKTPGSTYFVHREKIIVVNKKKFSLNFFNKYIIFFYGVFLIWKNYINKKQVVYLNYLPFWNFVILLLLPSKTILGPITGGSYYQNVNIFEKCIRKFIFPLAYYFSEFIILVKFKRAIFSTELLKKFIFNVYRKRFIFNAVLLAYSEKSIIKKKNIDFLIYYRNHTTKNPFFFRNIIIKLKKLNYSMVVFGDRINVPGVVSYTKISREKLLILLNKSRSTIISNENFYSLFCIDSISFGLSIFYDEIIKPKVFFFNKSKFIPLDFTNIDSSLIKLGNHLKHLNQLSNIKIPNIKFYKELKKIEFYNKDLFIN
jgi:hypothetical protein